MCNVEKIIETNRAFEENINYTFKDKNLLLLALTHSSYTNENKKWKFPSNERIEFLGDSVLCIVISEYLYLNRPDMAEGKMSKVRSGIVREISLADVARKIKLDEYILLGKGEEVTGGRHRDSILEDSFESLVGAIYLDSDLETIRKFILTSMEDIIKKIINGKIILDFKSRLQERVQHDGVLGISYNIIKEEGPDHDKKFKVNVEIDGKVMGEGIGRSKKEAEQNAAKQALERINNA
ncbi:MAG: ribonuclease III [Clostridiales bacterium]|nr:ribonuclease III [Clostridiales bacterium]